MATAKESLPRLLEIEGCLGACIVDSNSGMTLASTGGNAVDLEAAAAGNTEVVRAKRKTMKIRCFLDRIFVVQRAESAAVSGSCARGAGE